MKTAAFDVLAFCVVCKQSVAHVVCILVRCHLSSSHRGCAPVILVLGRLLGGCEEPRAPVVSHPLHGFGVGSAWGWDAVDGLAFKVGMMGRRSVQMAVGFRSLSTPTNMPERVQSRRKGSVGF